LGNKHSNAQNFILTSTCTLHMGNGIHQTSTWTILTFEHLHQFRKKACITTQKKKKGRVGSIPDGVTEIFH
jgi:hypothetical protein